MFVSRGSRWIIGGFGVTVFFFLSGLITTLMVRAANDRQISVRNFYRVACYEFCHPSISSAALAHGLAVVGVLPSDLQFRVELAQGLHCANYWYIWFGADGSAAGTVPYWSLAVKEHFYLVFPLLYIGLNRLMSNRAQARTFWALCAIVCAWRCLLVLVVGVTENRTFMASDTRVDSILFGCALAVAMNPVLDSPRGSDRLWKSVLLPAGLLLLTFTFVYRAPWFRETIRYTLQGIALTPVFVTAIRFPRWLPFRALNARPVAYVGVLSYTLYWFTGRSVLVAISTALDPVQRFSPAAVVHRGSHHSPRGGEACLGYSDSRARIGRARDHGGQTAVPQALSAPLRPSSRSNHPGAEVVCQALAGPRSQGHRGVDRILLGSGRERR